MSQRVEERKKEFKKGADDGRRRREDNAVQIRKTDRDDRLKAKRMQLLSPTNEDYSRAEESSEEVALRMKTVYQKLLSPEYNEKFQGALEFRRVLSVEKAPPIQHVIQSGAVPVLVSFLGQDDLPDLQLQAAWALTNVASGRHEDTQAVVGAGAIPYFIRLLQAPREDVREQAVWALGNIAGDSANYRDMVLRENCMHHLIQILRSSNDNRMMMKNAAWALSNLCRAKPAPELVWISPALPVLQHLMTMDDDLDLLSDACWAISYITDNGQVYVEPVVQSGFCVTLVHLAQHISPKVQTPALRALGNIVTGTDDQTQAVIDAGGLQAFRVLLNQSDKPTLVKETCWTLSNIAAGNKAQIQLFLQSGVVNQLVQYAGRHVQMDVKKEAVWALANAAAGGTSQQNMLLVEMGCLRPLCLLLQVTDAWLRRVICEGLYGILTAGQDMVVQNEWPANTYVEQIEFCGGRKHLEAIRYQVATADKILNKFYKEDDWMEDEMKYGNPPEGGYHF